MNTPTPLGKISLILICLLMVAICIQNVFLYTYDHKTRIVFCDVGQGDGVYMRINNRIDILIDAGPPHSITQCVGKYMPFYDRTIEFAFISHHHADHYGGFSDIIQRYQIQTLLVNIPPEPTEEFKSFLLTAKSKQISIKPFFQGDILRVGDAIFESKWPIQSVVEKSTSNVNPNDLSQVIRFTQRSMTILFTGDITQESDKRLLQQSGFDAFVLKVPHHGSTNGLTEELISLAHPRVAVISVGKKNRYGHPTSAILKHLHSQGIKVLRTDELENISFTL